MEITAAGYVLLPLGLFLLVLGSTRALLCAVAFFAPFSATAVVNVGEFVGIQPGYYFAFLFFVQQAGLWVARDRPPVVFTERTKYLAPLWVFVAIALLSILFIPFRESLHVRRPDGHVEMLALHLQNATQWAYLLFVVGLATVIGHTRLGREDLVAVCRALVLSGVFVALWGWVQVATFQLNLSYPAFLFNNSVSFAQRYGSPLGVLGIQRISSVTPEPSMFARFMLVPIFLTLYSVYRQDLLMSRRLAILTGGFMTVTALASASTTAFAGVVAGLAMLLLVLLRERPSRLLSGRGVVERIKISAGFVGGAVALGIVGGLAGLLVLGLSPAGILDLVRLVVVEKIHTVSAETRLGNALRGLALLAEHPFLGVGWGSNRTMDLATHVLANTGVVGALVFFGVQAALIRRGLAVGRKALMRGRARIGALVRGLALVLGVVLFGKIAAEPDIVYLDHWVIIGVIIAALPIAESAAENSGQPRRRGSLNIK